MGPALGGEARLQRCVAIATERFQRFVERLQLGRRAANKRIQLGNLCEATGVCARAHGRRRSDTFGWALHSEVVGLPRALCGEHARATRHRFVCAQACTAAANKRRATAAAHLVVVEAPVRLDERRRKERRERVALKRRRARLVQGLARTRGERQLA